MVDEIHTNKKALGTLVIKLKKFTEDELVNALVVELKKERFLFEPFWSINRYLRHFCDIGILVSDGDKYFLASEFKY